MNHLTILLISTSMFFTNLVVAQKRSTIIMQWRIAATLPADSGQQQSLGFAGPVTGVHNDVLFIAGGANFPDAMPWKGGEKKFYNEIYVYTHKQKTLVPLKKFFTLPSTIAYPACCNTPTGVLYAGGENENGISDKVWLMQWDASAQEVIFKNLPSLPIPVSNAAATFIGHKVYLAGGESSLGAISQFLSLDLDKEAEGWKQLTDVPHPVSHMVLIAASGKISNKIYLLGGRKKNSNGISDLYADVFVFDLSKNRWETKAALPYNLSAGTASLYNTDYILMFGGDKGTTFHNVEILNAAINAEKDETKKQELTLQKNNLQTEHPGFSKEVLQYNLKKNTWKAIGVIPFKTPVTTTAVKWAKDIMIPSGEIKAGVRSPEILSVKLLSKAK